MDESWATLITGQFAATIILAIAVVALWRRLLEREKELKDERLAAEAKEEKERAKLEASDKETLGVLSGFVKLLESFPAVSKEQADRVIRQIEHAVEAINKHTDDHVKPGRKATP